MIPKDPGVWIALFGFLGTCVTSVRWLMRVWYLGHHRTNEEKAKLDMSVERFKASEAGKFVASLQKTVSDLKQVVESHTTLFNQMDASIKSVKDTEVSMMGLMADLKEQHANFNTRMNNTNAGGALIIKRLSDIETDVQILKASSGNVFVTTKKPGGENGK